MADDVNSLVFDQPVTQPQNGFTPRPATAPTTQGLTREMAASQQGPGGPGVSVDIDPSQPGASWQRILDAAKRGLISSSQVDALAQKMGYSQNKPAAPDIAGAGKDAASNFGGAVGGLAGSVGRSIYDKANAPAQPGAPMDISAPTISAPTGGGGIPSPAWNL